MAQAFELWIYKASGSSGFGIACKKYETLTNRVTLDKP